MDGQGRLWTHDCADVCEWVETLGQEFVEKLQEGMKQMYKWKEYVTGLHPEKKEDLDEKVLICTKKITRRVEDAWSQLIEAEAITQRAVDGLLRELRASEDDTATVGYPDEEDLVLDSDSNEVNLISDSDSDVDIAKGDELLVKVNGKYLEWRE